MQLERSENCTDDRSLLKIYSILFVLLNFYQIIFINVKDYIGLLCSTFNSMPTG